MSVLNADPKCIFCKIIAGQIPSRKVYEDEDVFAFHDINPWAPVHFLIIPKRHIPSMAQVGQAEEALLGKIMGLAPKLALEQGCEPYPQGGFRLLANTGDQGGQEVHHLHFHVMGGPRPWLRG
jgi:histidine triad (HIT) family protein